MAPRNYYPQRGRTFYPVIIATLCLALFIWLLYSLQLEHVADDSHREVSVSDILGSDDSGDSMDSADHTDHTQGYARAYEPRKFSFPRDHGPHPDYRHEWWYYTGNLVTDSGRRFGYQLTFFRFALTPDKTKRSSPWAATQMMMAHFALSDVKNHKFYHFEKISRVALDLAGSVAQPFDVWVDNWSATGTPDNMWPLKLHAVHDDTEIDLTLVPIKPLVLQGDQGLSRKSAKAGNASYYYSYTHLQTSGKLQVGENEYNVTGFSWLDREWGTSALAGNQQGWDWFALQLSDGRELMVYQLRRKDGSVDPFSSGMLINAKGSAQRLTAQGFNLQVLSQWRSPRTGILYPSHWRLTVPDEALEIEVKPLLEDQELHVSLNYWEGAVKVQGTQNNNSVTGYGYVELTGYDKGGSRTLMH